MSSPTQPRRADHIRNRALLLDAARAVFAEQGADAPIEEITQRAGVAKGTFFRHFATKVELVQALLADRFTTMGEVAREINATHEPGWATLAYMVERIIDHMANDRSLAEFVERRERIPMNDEIHAARAGLDHEIDRAVIGAQERGEVRPDVKGRDFPHIMLMVSRAAARQPSPDAALGKRYLRIFLDGVRTGEGRDLSELPALGDAFLLPGRCAPQRTSEQSAE